MHFIDDYDNEFSKCFLVKEGLCCGRIVLVSSVRLMKEVFNLKITTDRPEMIISTARNKIISNGRTSEIGEYTFPSPWGGEILFPGLS